MTMKRYNLGDLVASGMNDVLESNDFKKIFAKPQVEAKAPVEKKAAVSKVDPDLQAFNSFASFFADDGDDKEDKDDKDDDKKDKKKDKKKGKMPPWLQKGKKKKEDKDDEDEDDKEDKDEDDNDALDMNFAKDKKKDEEDEDKDEDDKEDDKEDKKDKKEKDDKKKDKKDDEDEEDDDKNDATDPDLIDFSGQKQKPKMPGHPVTGPGAFAPKDPIEGKPENPHHYLPPWQQKPMEFNMVDDGLTASAAKKAKCDCPKDCPCKDGKKCARAKKCPKHKEMYAKALRYIVNTLSKTSAVLDEMDLDLGAIATMDTIDTIVREASIKMAHGFPGDHDDDEEDLELGLDEPEEDEFSEGEILDEDPAEYDDLEPGRPLNFGDADDGFVSPEKLKSSIEPKLIESGEGHVEHEDCGHCSDAHVVQAFKDLDAWVKDGEEE